MEISPFSFLVSGIELLIWGHRPLMDKIFCLINFLSFSISINQQIPSLNIPLELLINEILSALLQCQIYKIIKLISRNRLHLKIIMGKLFFCEIFIFSLRKYLFSWWFYHHTKISLSCYVALTYVIVKSVNTKNIFQLGGLFSTLIFFQKSRLWLMR